MVLRRVCRCRGYAPIQSGSSVSKMRLPGGGETDGTNKQLDSNGGHQRAEEDDADRLDPFAALLSPLAVSTAQGNGCADTYDRVLVHTRSCSKRGGDEHYEGRYEVHLWRKG